MKSKIMKLANWLAVLTLVFNNPGFADEAQLLSMIQSFQEQMKQMQRTIDQQNDRIRQLERREPHVQAAAPSAEAAPPMSDYEFNERLANATGGANKWLKDLSFKGDLRLRYEAFDFTSGHPSETDPRNRFRFRLRYGFEKKFSEDMKIGFSMASGEASGGQNVDPTSTNATFDNLFNFKDIFIEKVFASYSPSWAKRGPIEKLNITAGKMDNPFERGSSDMIWDRDVKPEGAAEKIDLKLFDGENFDLGSFVTAGQYILDEDGTVGGDSELFGYQGGFNVVAYTPLMERPVEFTTALSRYSYNDYAQKSNFFIGTTSLARGNLACSGTTLCAGDFELWESYNELAFYPGGLPIRPFIDFARNADSSTEDEDAAWALGLKLGGIVKKGDWEVGYAYKRIENESVPGAFNDSDFGLGHTGKRGSAIKAAYALTDNITLNGAAFFVNNLETGTASVRDEEQRRFQVDLVWKF